MLASCGAAHGSRGVVKIWSATAAGVGAVPVCVMDTHGRSGVECARLSASGEASASCGDDLALCGVREGGAVALRLGDAGSGERLRCVDFDKTSRLVATGGDGGVLSVWDVKRRRVVRSIDDHASAIGCCRFDAASGTLASGNAAGEVLLHRVRSKQLLALLACGDDGASRPPAAGLEFSPLKPQILGAVHADGSLRLWDAARGELVARVGGDGDGDARAARRGLAFSPVNAKFVASTTGQEKGDSTSLQRECSARARFENSTHASRAPREMIARPKISRNERKSTEI